MDIAPDIAMALAERVPRAPTEGPGADRRGVAAQAPAGGRSTCAPNGGIFAFVGPTGVGKTTTIAKLAARWGCGTARTTWRWSAPTIYRIGAREQLMTFARILGVPMHVATSGKELARVLERLEIAA